MMKKIYKLFLVGVLVTGIFDLGIFSSQQVKAVENETIEQSALPNEEMVSALAAESTIHVTYYDAETGDELNAFDISGEVGTQFTDHFGELSAQFPAGYSLSPDPRTDYSPTFVEGEVGTASFYFTKDAPVESTIHVTYYDADTGEVLKEFNVSGEVGTQFTDHFGELSAQFPTGYSLSPDPRTDYSPTFVEGEVGTASFYFTKDTPVESTIHVTYYDADTGEVLKEFNVSGEVGTQFTDHQDELAAQYPEGYSLSPDPRTEYSPTFVEGEVGNARFYFTKDAPVESTIHVTYYDADTGEVLKEFNVSGEVGTQFTDHQDELTAQYPAGYSLSPDPRTEYSPTFVEGEVGNARFYFTKDTVAQAKINVEFYDQDTGKVIGNTEVSGEVGTTLNAKRSEVEAKYPRGYTLVSDNDSYNTEFVDGDSTTVRINFKKDEEQLPDEGKINVEFYDQDTGKVIGNTEVSGEVGTTLNAKRSEVEAKYPSGYTLVSDNDSYNTEFVDGDSTTVRINFKKDPQPVPANGTIHIQFIDQTTKAILKEFDVSGTVGTTLAEYKKELENHFPTDYKLVSDADIYKLVFKSDEAGTARLYFEKIKLAAPTINSVPGVQSSGQSSTYQRTNTLGNQPITSNTKNTSTTIPKLNDSKNSYLIVIGFLVLGGALLLFKRNTRKNIH